MNIEKERILELLKLLRSKLPSDSLINDSSEKSQLYDYLAKRIVETNDGIRKLETLEDVASDELDKLAFKYNNLLDDIELEYLELNQLRSSSNTYECDIVKTEKKIAILNNRLNKTNDEEEKKNIQKSLDEEKEFLKNYNENLSNEQTHIEEQEKKIANLEKKLAKLEKNIKIQKEIAFEENNELYEEKLAQRRKEADILKGKLGYLDISGMLDSLIVDYENDVTNEAEVNYQINVINTYLNNPNIRGMMRYISEEQESLTEDQMLSISEEIDNLNMKLSDDNNYIMSKEDYNLELKKLQREYKKLQRKDENATNQVRITKNQIADLIESKNKELNATTIEAIDKQIKIKEKLLDKQEKKNSKISMDLAAKEYRLKQLEESYGKVNFEEKQADQERINELKNKLNEIKMFNVFNPFSIDDTIKAIINATKNNDMSLDQSEEINQDIDEKSKDEKTDAEEHKEEENLNTEEKKDEEKSEKIEFPILSEDELNVPAPVREPEKIKDITEPSNSLKEKIKKIWQKAKAYILTTIAIAGIGTGVVLAAKNNEKMPEESPVISDTMNDEITDATKKELYELIEICKNVEESLYTEESYDNLQIAVGRVEFIITTGGLSETSAKRHIEALNAAYSSLVLVENKENVQNPTVTPEVEPTVTPENKEDEIYLDKNETIVLMPGDSVQTQYGSVDYNGNQTDKDGNVIGHAEVEKQEDGSVLVDNSDLVNKSTVSENNENLDNGLDDGFTWNWDAFLEDTQSRGM